MTGMYVRVKRDGNWKNVELEYLTEAELRTCFEHADKDRVILFLAGITKWMREHLIEDEHE